MSLRHIIDLNLKTKILNLVEEWQEGGEEFVFFAVVFLAKQEKREQKKKIINRTYQI